MRLVAPEVRELVTSLDMAGCSLTVTWLDDELEPLVAGAVPDTGLRPIRADRRRPHQWPTHVPARAEAVPPGPQRDDGLVVTRWQQPHEPWPRAEAELGRLDAVAGDGDHGTAMVRGSAAAAEAARQAAGDERAALAAAATAWGEAAGGTSGVLVGAAH